MGGLQGARQRATPTQFVVFTFLAALIPLGSASAAAPSGALSAEAVGGRFAFLGTDLVRDVTDLFVASNDGSGKTNLTAGLDLRYLDPPAWSPDGTQIAFFGYDHQVAGYAFTAYADGTGLVELPGVESYGVCCGPRMSWSPDGTRIAFIGQNIGETGLDIYEVTPSADIITRLTYQGFENMNDLTWGPSGLIAFTAAREYWLSIYRLDPSSGDVTQLTPTDFDGEDIQAAWSPDGSMIAFLRDPAFSPRTDLYVMDWDGANQVNLTQNEGAFWFDHLAWSTDGQQIAYTADPLPLESGDLEIYVTGVEGGAQLDITNLSGDEISPAWSPDGTEVAFVHSGIIAIVAPDGTNLHDVIDDRKRRYSSPAWAPPVRMLEYAALGDSFSSGEGIPPFDIGTDIPGRDECHRSTQAYGRDFARSQFGYAINHRACSGAMVGDFYSPKWPAEPAQLDWLGPDTGLVTLTIGGNDVGFADLMFRCWKYFSRTCDQSREAQWTRNAIATWLPERLEALYGRVRTKAPTARIIVMGYPDIIPDPESIEEGCSGLDRKKEMPWLRETAGLLNEAIRTAVHERQAAGDSDIGFLDVLTDFAGHEVCTEEPWVNPVVLPPNKEYSFHPNAIGQYTLAAQLEACVYLGLCEG